MGALRWAIGQAVLTGATVDAVIAWTYPALDGGYGWSAGGAGADFDFKDVAAKILTEAVSSTSDSARDVRVRTQVTEGIPAQGLLDACDGADLLVVGSRGTAASPRRCSVQ
jgi:nucleotide-binding universal stress UspA family protein